MLNLLLFSLFFCLCSSEIQTGQGKRWPQFSHKIVSTNILNVTESVDSVLRCVALCASRQDCVSVFYRRKSRRCQFHDVLFLSPQDGQQDNGTKYYSMTIDSCPPDYIHFRPLGLCYQLHLDKILYDAGVSDCASRGEHLIVIDTQEKQDHVKKQMTASSDAMMFSYYIDGRDAETEGQWKYHDGQPVSFFAWAGGYPLNSTADRDYLVMSKAGGLFLWQDRKKAETKYYMCQKDI